MACATCFILSTSESTRASNALFRISISSSSEAGFEGVVVVVVSDGVSVVCDVFTGAVVVDVCAGVAVVVLLVSVVEGIGIVVVAGVVVVVVVVSLEVIFDARGDGFLGDVFGVVVVEDLLDATISNAFTFDASDVDVVDVDVVLVVLSVVTVVAVIALLLLLLLLRGEQGLLLFFAIPPLSSMITDVLFITTCFAVEGVSGFRFFFLLSAF